MQQLAPYIQHIENQVLVSELPRGRQRVVRDQQRLLDPLTVSDIPGLRRPEGDETRRELRPGADVQGSTNAGQRLARAATGSVDTRNLGYHLCLLLRITHRPIKER